MAATDTAINSGAKADFESHRIEGFADASGERFSVPLISHIEGTLWMGGKPEGEMAKAFDYVVNLYGVVDYKLREGQTFVLHVMHDSASQALEREQMLTLAQTIKRFMANGRTLVHCQAGLNRSGLLVALTLMLHGMPAREAIALLREKRCAQVLCNSHFAHWLQMEDRRLRGAAIA